MNLRDEFYNCTNETVKLVLAAPWYNQNFYVSWLAQQYYLVQHSTRLLSAFSITIPLAEYAAYKNVLQHLNEESGHDEWLISDMKALGASPKDFKPLPSISGIVKSQYYQIEHDLPISFTGYSQFLEVLAVRVASDVADIVQSSLGDGCVTFLRGHYEADQDHIVNGFERMEGASDIAKEKIIENLSMVADLYNNALRTLIGRCLG